jgi:hypothetical protein
MNTPLMGTCSEVIFSEAVSEQSRQGSVSRVEASIVANLAFRPNDVQATVEDNRAISASRSAPDNQLLEPQLWFCIPNPRLKSEVAFARAA